MDQQTAIAHIQASLKAAPGDEVGLSDWVSIDQKLVDQFAACTGDHQWIHVDPERAARESPFGTTIAHGYLVLSLLPRFKYELNLLPKSVAQALNYGADRIRFPSPVRIPGRLRDRITLIALEAKGEGRVLMTLRHSVEIEGETRPALVADTLTLLML